MANLVEVTISAKNSASGPIKQVSGDLKELDGTGSKLGGALGGVATKMAAVGVVAGGALAVGLGSVVKTSMDFSHQMSDVGAATGEAGAGLDKLRGLALDLGKDVDLAGVDATEAAKAIAELGRGGVSAGDLLDGAAKGGLLLFSAGAKDVESAAGIAIQAMTTFGLTGKDVGHVADVIAAGANKSATSVDALGQAFNMSAAVAQGAGLSLEELAGTLSFLAQRGLQGSDAGTSLKTALQRLQAPTAEAANLMDELGINVRDAEGHMLPMADIADVLKARLGGLSDAQRDAALQTIFGADAIRVALPLIQGGGDAIREWTDKVNDAGYAARIGKQKNDDLFGSFEQLKATIQTGAIEIGQRWEPAIRRATDAGTKFIGDVLANPAVQRGLEDFANKGAAALDTLIAKLQDPTFQTQMKEWGTAALDTGKAVVSLAGDIKDTLGPPLVAVAKWFGDLDANGKNNVLTFGLVTGSVASFHKELGTLLSVGNSVIKMFAAKEAAKKTLTTANQTLAGSAGKTATAFGSVGTAAGIAVTVLPLLVIAAGNISDRMSDADVAIQKVAASLSGPLKTAILDVDKATTMEGVKDFFTGQHTEATKATQAVHDWANGMSGAIPTIAQMQTQLDILTAASKNSTNQSTEELRTRSLVILALAGEIAAREQLNATEATRAAYLTSEAQASQVAAVGITATVVATSSLAASMGLLGPVASLVGTGLTAAALAAGGLAVPAQASALALADLNSYGTSAQTALNNFGSTVMASILQVQGLSAELDRLATTFGQNENKMKSVSTESSQLGGWLQTLQGEWDKLDVAVKAQGFTTDEQKARYAELSPLIQYLNGHIGELHTSTVGLTEDQVKNWMAIQNLNAAIAEGGAKAAGATSALGIMGSMVRAGTDAANGGVGAQNAHAQAMAQTTGAATTAAGAISSVGLAIKMVPRDFTVTAHVDISQAMAAIETLSNNIPRSPAKEGPFRQLPNWQAIYEGLAPAGAWATGTMGATLGEMADQLSGLESRISGIGSSSSKLQGWLSTLQGPNGAQGDPSGDSVEAIAFLNDQLAKNAVATKQTTLEAVKSYQAWLQLGGQVDETGKTAASATSPVQGLGQAIASVPKSFTVVGNVDVLPGLEAIGLLAASLPTPTASKGPLAELPDWGALFKGLPIAASTAGATTLAAMQATLGQIPANIDTMAGQLYGSGAGLVMNLANGWQESAPGVLALASGLGAEALAEFRKYDDRAKDAGKQLFGNIGAGFQEVAPGITTMVSTLAADIARTTRQIDADLATMTAQFGASGDQAAATKEKATDITVTLGDGLSVFDKLIPIKDKPTVALAAVGQAMDDALGLAGGLVNQAKLVREDALDFLRIATEAEQAFDKGLQILGGIGKNGAQQAQSAALFVPQAPGVSGGTYTVPGRAAGGPVAAGQMYMVGENGPEYFLPRQSGTIVPNGAGFGGGGGGNMYISINVAGSVISEGQLVDKVRAGLLQKGRTVPTLGFN